MINPPKSELQTRKIIAVTGKLSHHLSWDTQQVIKVVAAYCVGVGKLGHSLFGPAPLITRAVCMLVPFGVSIQEEIQAPWEVSFSQGLQKGRLERKKFVFLQRRHSFNSIPAELAL